MTDQSSRGDGNKVLAGILGILFGGLGFHRFVLGDIVGGFLRILITVVTCGIGSLIGFVEGIIYLTKSDEEFIETYVDGDKSWF
jgi:TM2 domain-containing membrane protein YozV